MKNKEEEYYNDYGFIQLRTNLFFLSEQVATTARHKFCVAGHVCFTKIEN
ncbi:6870_t:CDS:2 [Funneliformis mosseae]|uniref:6870_t:CDS:1 n=1 Tax=Funneliformis mosseae TaxID=27381 RepID=A0A9N9DA86_FUNMO|nr:6870_t:CDS:2 [Funneliformis mosseae]